MQYLRTLDSYTYFCFMFAVAWLVSLMAKALDLQHQQVASSIPGLGAVE